MDFDFFSSENIGKEYNGFILLSIDDLCDYKTKGLYFRHKKTGLEVYHITANDCENLFSFGFRTLSKNSKGCAHIVEHSVFCGSEKFPLREPFSVLDRQSVKTFLNAMTYPDKTAYPASSKVQSDYFNLMNVYADAVFFPLLTEEAFSQEGHRLEIDKNGKISIQGIVFNEMKGEYSAFSSVACDEIIRKMYPDSVYEYDSGGDPLVIPTLTYEEFKDFHKKFYTPSNCLLFLYGNIPTAVQLDFINNEFTQRLIQKYGIIENSKNIFSQFPLCSDEIKKIQKTYVQTKTDEFLLKAPETDSTGCVCNVCYASGEDNIEKHFLSEVLCGNDSSPLSKKLKDSKLGDSLSPLFGDFNDFDSKNCFFSFGLNGVKKENRKKVYELIKNSLLEIYKDGIDQKEIESAVMGMDFSLREVNRIWGGPYSIMLMEFVMNGWKECEKPCSKLFPISEFEEVKKKLSEDSKFTEKLIKKYFIDFQNPVCITVEPDKNFHKNREKKEKELTKKISFKINKSELSKKNELLHLYQQKTESEAELSCIPHLKISELSENTERFEVKTKILTGNNEQKIPLVLCDEETNGIAYIDVYFPLDVIDVKDYPLVPLFTNVLTDLGWNNKSWSECTTDSARIMGDLWASSASGTALNLDSDFQKLEGIKSENYIGRDWLVISCKILNSKADEALKMLSEIIRTVNFCDCERFESLMTEFCNRRKRSVVKNGSNYSVKRTRSNFTRNTAIEETWSGFSQIQTASSYNKNCVNELLNKFLKMYEKIINSGSLIHITGDEITLKTLIPLCEKFVKIADLKSLCNKNLCSKEEIIKLNESLKNCVQIKDEKIVREEMNHNSLVGFSALSFKASSYLTKESAAETVLAQWLSNHALWEKIRTTGGAYGSYAINSGIENVFSIYSYRDPNPKKSLETFIEILNEAGKNLISEQDIERSIIACYSDEVSPVSPSTKGNICVTRFLYGIPSDSLAKKIKLLKSVKPEDVQDAAKRLLNEALKKRYEFVISG